MGFPPDVLGVELFGSIPVVGATISLGKIPVFVWFLYEKKQPGDDRAAFILFALKRVQCLNLRR